MHYTFYRNILLLSSSSARAIASKRKDAIMGERTFQPSSTHVTRTRNRKLSEAFQQSQRPPHRSHQAAQITGHPGDCHLWCYLWSGQLGRHRVIWENQTGMAERGFETAERDTLPRHVWESVCRTQPGGIREQLHGVGASHQPVDPRAGECH